MGPDEGDGHEDGAGHEDLEGVEDGLGEGGPDGGRAHVLGGLGVAVGEDLLPAQPAQHAQAHHGVRRQ